MVFVSHCRRPVDESDCLENLQRNSDRKSMDPVTAVDVAEQSAGATAVKPVAGLKVGGEEVGDVEWTLNQV